MREEDAGRYQMLWDCPACETPKLLGIDHRHCPNCGNPQDPKRRYFPPEGEEIAVNDHAYHGADLKCPACETPCSAVANNCGACGAGLDAAKSVEQRSEQIRGERDDFAKDTAKTAKTDFKAQKAGGQAPPPASPPPQAKPAKSKKGLFIALGVIGIVIVLIAVVMLWKKPVDLVAQGHQWERTIKIEQFKATTASAWKKSVPSKAYGLSCKKEVKDHKKVPDGEECKMKRKDLGDGTYKKVKVCKPKYRKEPIYGSKCRYKIDKWTAVRTEKASGGLSDTVAWPQVKLTRSGQCRGCERQGSKAEKYEVTFKDSKSGDTDSCGFAEARWRSIAKGSKWKSSASVLTGGLDCSALKPL